MNGLPFHSKRQKFCPAGQLVPFGPTLIHHMTNEQGNGIYRHEPFQLNYDLLPVFIMNYLGPLAVSSCSGLLLYAH